jgi:cell division protease FtsH
VGDNEHDLFLGREIQHRREVSEQTAQLVDAEVKRVINRAYERAKKTLEENVELLHAVAASLLERETLTREDIAVLMRGEKLPPMSPPPAIVSTPTPPPVAAEARPKNPPLLGGPEPSPA